MKTYTYIFTIFLFLSNLTVFSQNDMKYKDVIEIVETSNKVVAFQTLNSYIRQCVKPEPELLNAYYRNALICYEWAKKYDPLKETHDVKYFTEQTIVNLDSAKAKMNEKKFRKTRKYFNNLTEVSDEKLQPSDILSDINLKLENISNFQEKIENIIFNFNTAADKYDKCLTIFRDINGKYNELNDLHMMYTDELDKQIKQLTTEFDSTLYYFDNYKKALKTFPVKEYKQDYKLRKIIVYRLDGLTSSSFFDNTVVLWDYKIWADELYLANDKKIDPLRKLIKEADKNIEADLKLAKSDKILPENHKPYVLEQELMFAISRFDSRHLVFDIFNYKQNQTDFLNFAKDTVSTANTRHNTGYRKKARFYYELLEKKQICDSLIKELQSENVTNKMNFNKYEELFKAKFNDIDGLIAYERLQPTLNNKILQDGFNDYQKFIGKYKNRHLKKDSFINFNKIKIPLFISKPSNTDDINIEKYFTTDISEDNKGDLYILGYKQIKAKNKKAFIAKTSKLEKVLWLKYLDIKFDENKITDNFGITVNATDNGCIFLVRSTGSTGTKNFFMKFDDKGKKINEQELEEQRFPVKIFFNPMSEELLIAFKGNKLEKTYDPEEELMLYSFSPIADTVFWKTDITLTGELADIIKINNNFMLACNFKSFVDKNNNRIISKTGIKSTNVFSAIISEKGKFLKSTIYECKEPIFVDKIVKISDNIIQLTGEFEKNKKFLYMITNKNGVTKYKNF